MNYEQRTKPEIKLKPDKNLGFCQVDIQVIRQKPADLTVEPPYPLHDTVCFNIRFPNMTGHLKYKLCDKEYPHKISECELFAV